MTTQMIIALAITVFMIIIIMTDKLPFGAPPLLACLLLVVFGITDIKGAFAGFSNATIVMLAEFMALIAALQKTSFIAGFKKTMFNMANKGGFKAYVLMILVVMLACSLFVTGSTAYYVLTIGLLSTLPYSKKLPHHDRRVRRKPSADPLQYGAAVRNCNRCIEQRRRSRQRIRGQIRHSELLPFHGLPAELPDSVQVPA